MKKCLSLTGLLLILASQIASAADCPCWKNFKKLSGTCRGAGEVNYCGAVVSDDHPHDTEAYLGCGQDGDSGNFDLQALRYLAYWGEDESGSCIVKAHNKNTWKQTKSTSKPFYTKEEYDACAQLILAAGEDLGFDCITQ